MSTLAVEVALKRFLLPSFAESTGITPEVTWNPTTVIMQRVDNGMRADVIILIDEAMEKLVRSGLVLERSVRPIATANIGVAVARDAKAPKLDTVEDLKSAVLGARSVAYSRSGASGIYFTGLIERLGIAETVNAKATIIPEGFTAKQIVEGNADLAIQQISELMSVDGIHIAGPLPPEVQAGTDFSVAIFADAGNPEDALRLLDHLSSREAEEAYKNGGLTPRSYQQ